ncbi:MAG TPA: FAD-dependent monooxygenase [Acidimicrobiia bacterium]
MAGTAARNGRHEVVVVGAGPVGLTAALAVRARGLPVTVLEGGAEGRQRPGSRAIYYHRQTLERWGSICAGLDSEIARHGITWSTKQTYWRGRLVYDKTYPPPDPSALPPFTSLAQVATEQLLLDACKAAGVDFVWEREVADLDSTPDGVELRTADGRVLDAAFVVAADGARSAVRAGLGIALSGSRSENHFVIVDVADPDGALRPARIFHYEHPAVEGRNVLLVPFAGGWRADLQCRPTDDPERFNDEDGVRRWIGQVMPPAYAESVTWVSTYQFLQAVADRFADEHRRVLLVGEAAHLFAPFGARGLNSGVPDAIAAADAIARARTAGDRGAAQHAIDEFAETRRTAAEYNRAAAATALRHMQARGPAIRARRFVAAQLARRSERAGKWLDSAPYGPRARQGAAESIY